MPPQTQSSRPPPSTVAAPQAPPASGAPPHPPKGTTQTYAATVAGTSNLDEAARKIVAVRQSRKGKKMAPAGTSATKVAQTTKKASPGRPQPLLPVLQEDLSPLARLRNLTLMLPTSRLNYPTWWLLFSAKATAPSAAPLRLSPTIGAQ